MKKLMALLLCVCLALGMVPAIAEDAAETEITSKNFRAYFGTLTEIWREDFPVYFLNGAEDLPFVNLEDWKDLMIYVYKNADKNGDKEFGLTYSVSEDGTTVTLTRETGYTMDVDFENGTMQFLDYVAFVKAANLPYMDIGGVPEAKDGKPFLLQATQTRDLYGDMTTVDLSDYNIPMVAQDGKYLLPMQTLSAFTLSDIGVGAYFNGQALYLNPISAMADPAEALQTNLSLNGLLTADVIAKYQSFEGTPEEKINQLLELVSSISDQGKKIAEYYKKSLETSLYVMSITSQPPKHPAAKRSSSTASWNWRWSWIASTA